MDIHFEIMLLMCAIKLLMLLKFTLCEGNLNVTEGEMSMYDAISNSDL